MPKENEKYCCAKETGYTAPVQGFGEFGSEDIGRGWVTAIDRSKIFLKWPEAQLAALGQ